MATHFKMNQAPADSVWGDWKTVQSTSTRGPSRHRVRPHYSNSHEARIDEIVLSRRDEDEKADLGRREHVRSARHKHFSRKMDDKKVLKKKKRSAWINKKASKKRRK